MIFLVYLYAVLNIITFGLSQSDGYELRDLDVRGLEYRVDFYEQ